MKEKRFDSDSFEKLWGGFFGIIAIAATVAEMIISGVDAATIAGAVKDIASTMVVVMVFLLSMKQLKPKNQKSFEATFNSKMEKVVEKYSPVLQKHGPEESAGVKDTIKYDIAARLDSISGNDPGAYHLMFRVKNEDSSIEFIVSSTVFGDNKGLTATRIYNKVLRSHRNFIRDAKPSSRGFTLTFANELRDDADATRLVEIVDYITLLYIAEYKK